MDFNCVRVCAWMCVYVCVCRRAGTLVLSLMLQSGIVYLHFKIRKRWFCFFSSLGESDRSEGVFITSITLFIVLSLGAPRIVTITLTDHHTPPIVCLHTLIHFHESVSLCFLSPAAAVAAGGAVGGVGSSQESSVFTCSSLQMDMRQAMESFMAW